MAKANAVTGATVYVPEGQNVPADVPDGVRLVGPGAPEPEPVDAEPVTKSAPEVEVEPEPPPGGEPAAAEPLRRRPAAADPKADWVAWAVACGLPEDQAAGMTKLELQALP